MEQATKDRIRATAKRTYSGKPGCMCGCNGNYNDSKETAAFKRAVTRIINNPNVIVHEDGGFAYVVTATRNNVVYFGDK